MEKKKNKKCAGEMSTTGLENYRHKPETELSILICGSKELEEYAELKDFLQGLSETCPEKIHATDSIGMTALHFAVACGCLPAVTLLLKFGALVNVQDKLGFTPLFLATGRYPNVEIALHLIKEGNASVTITTKTGTTALHGAALQGNKECVELLLKHGANPLTEDKDGTTALELAKNSNIQAILHDAIIEVEKNKEVKAAECANCKKKGTKLKRCGGCQLMSYCDRDCQTKHWYNVHKQECAGFVIGKPMRMNGDMDEYQMSFYHVLGSNSSNVKMFNRQPKEAADKMEFLRKKRFIVKVQLPIGVFAGDMMVYNADRTCEGFIHYSEKDYGKLARKVRTEGYLGIKAFFWANLCEGNNGEFKVYYGKTAPFQNW